MKPLRLFKAYRHLEKIQKQQSEQLQSLGDTLRDAQVQLKQTEESLRQRERALAELRHSRTSRAHHARPALMPFILNSNLATITTSKHSHLDLSHAMAGNSGNPYITHAMLKSVGMHSSLLHADQQVRNVWEDTLPDPDWVNANYSHCFLTLQDQFQASRPNYIASGRIEAITRFVNALKIPLVTYSVGTNFAPDDTSRRICDELCLLLQAISGKCASIGIRGEITNEALAKIGVTNAKVIGCPTYFENGAARILKKKPLTPDVGILGTGLFSTHAPNPIHFIAQSETLGMKLALGGAPEPDDIKELLACANAYPGYANAFLRSLKSGRVHAFHDMDVWRHYITSSDIVFAAGTRLHGSIMAINSGVPAVCTAGDTRASETCAHLGIPHRPGLCGLDAEPAELLASLDIDALNTRYRETFDIYAHWLEENNL
jgi:hypothetical protein